MSGEGTTVDDHVVAEHMDSHNYRVFVEMCRTEGTAQDLIEFNNRIADRAERAATAKRLTKEEYRRYWADVWECVAQDEREQAELAAKKANATPA